MKSRSSPAGLKFAEGPNNAKVMLVGQNPGKEEVKLNRPFVGRAGKYLNRVLTEKGIDRDKLYLTCVVKEPTPANRKPTAEEINRWMPLLVREMEKIKPQIVVLMGNVARKAPRLKDIEYIETYHPAAAMRFPGFKQKFENDIGNLGHRMGMGRRDPEV